MKDERDFGRSRGTETGTATASAKTEGETGKDLTRVDEGNETAHATAPDDAKTEAVGFAPFRGWANRTIRRLPGGVTLNYGGVDQLVTEITVDGQIRLENVKEGGFNLISLDERYIPSILKQLLAE